jgi:hypothetical protein
MRGSGGAEPGGPALELLGVTPCAQSRERGVAGAYAVFDTPAICAGSSIRAMRVLLVEDEPYMAEAIRDGLRLEAIATALLGLVDR